MTAAGTMPLIIVGASGFGREVLWVARNINARHPTYEILGFCDDNPELKDTLLNGCRILGSAEEVDARLAAKPHFICAIGNNAMRAKVVGRLLALSWTPVTLVDPSVVMAEDATIGVGTYVGAGSILSSNIQVGSYVILNHDCSLGHDAVLEDFAQVSPGGRVSGACTLKEGATLNSNAVVAPRRTVGRYATVGACSFAATNVPDRVTVIGNPARILMRHDKDKPT
jgi:sugar O-acyltransferase (sialic acid O-acetyltransferase NeuD family)